jgi:polyisoprenoid-binding protein YceI
MRKIFTAALIAVFLGTFPALAAKTDAFTFDKTHTQIFFSVSHLGFSFSTGSFTTFDGGFTFSEQKPEQSTVNVTIDAASLSLHDE